MLARLPNMLTVFRIILVPFFGIAMGFECFVVAAIIYITASITDVLDGYIARKCNVVSNFGKIADPTADKLLQAVALVMLSVKKVIHPSLVVVIFVKEILMAIATIILYRSNVVVSAKWYGKLATVIIFVTVIFMICVNSLFPYLGWQSPAFDVICCILFILTIVASVGAFFGYCIKYRKELRGALFH